jgi:hypothetical protein
MLFALGPDIFKRRGLGGRPVFSARSRIDWSVGLIEGADPYCCHVPTSSTRESCFCAPTWGWYPGWGGRFQDH